MSITLRHESGFTEAIIEDDGSLKRFYEIANILSDDPAVQITRKEDDFDTLIWHFTFKGHQLVLHYNIYTGISLYPNRLASGAHKTNGAVTELAQALENSLWTPAFAQVS